MWRTTAADEPQGNEHAAGCPAAASGTASRRTSRGLRAPARSSLVAAMLLALGSGPLQADDRLPPPPPPFGNFPSNLGELVQANNQGVGVALPAHAAAILALNVDIGAQTFYAAQKRTRQLVSAPGAPVVAALPLGGGASSDEGRWRLLFSGLYTEVDKDTPAARNEVGYSSKEKGGTVGVDFRVDPSLVVGAMYSRLEGDATFDSSHQIVRSDILIPDFSLGSADSTTDVFGVYLNWRRGNYFAEGFVSRRRTEYDIRRNLYQLFEVQTVTGSNTNTVDTFSATGGMTIAAAGGTLTPTLRLDHFRQRVSGYEEQGSSTLRNVYESHKARVTQLALGVDFARPFSTGIGVISPSIGAEWVHVVDSTDEGAAFRLIGVDQTRVYGAGGRDKDFGSIFAGVAAQLARGVSLFVRYHKVVELRDVSAFAVNAGIGVEF